MKVIVLEFPTAEDWKAVLLRALVTVGKDGKDGDTEFVEFLENWRATMKEPSEEWKFKILEARHSPIRRLKFSFYLHNIPYYVSTHLARHVHAQPHIKSQRNNRQTKYDRTKAPQDAPVNMIWDMSAEELFTIFNKRLCGTADATTRKVVEMMKDEVIERDPIYTAFAVPMCDHIGRCPEMFSCGRRKCND
jgi:thymidylate synthase ThyX